MCRGFVYMRTRCFFFSRDSWFRVVLLLRFRGAAGFLVWWSSPLYFFCLVRLNFHIPRVDGIPPACMVQGTIKAFSVLLRCSCAIAKSIIVRYCLGPGSRCHVRTDGGRTRPPCGSIEQGMHIYSKPQKVSTSVQPGTPDGVPHCPTSPQGCF